MPPKISDNRYWKLVLNCMDLAESSKIAYSYRIKRLLRTVYPQLKDNLELSPKNTYIYDAIHNFKNTKKAIEKNIEAETSKAGIASLVVTLMNEAKEKTCKKGDYQLWNEYHKELSKKLEENMSKNIANERQKDNSLTWEFVLQREKELAKTQYASMSHLAVATYCLMPPRRVKDYARVKIYDKKPLPPKGEDSFIDLTAKPATITILHGKTINEKHPEFRRELPEEYTKILKDNLAKFPRTWLFEKQGKNTNDNAYTNDTKSVDSFQITLSRMLTKSLGDGTKKISPNVLRHAYATYSVGQFKEDKKGLLELQKSAADMGHSIKMHLAYLHSDSIVENA